MRSVPAALAVLALAFPTIAIAQSQNGYRPGIVMDAGDPSSGWQADQDLSAGAPIVLARAVVVGPRGRRAVVGPRGRVVVGPRPRNFLYRGRNLTIVRRPAYVYPRGFGYRRWRAGQLLPLALIAAPFFFLEYEALGLEAPPPGYRWVRYGPDVVLVNVRTREIEDVAYGAIDEGDD